MSSARITLLWPGTATLRCIEPRPFGHEPGSGDRKVYLPLWEGIKGSVPVHGRFVGLAAAPDDQ